MGRAPGVVHAVPFLGRGRTMRLSLTRLGAIAFALAACAKQQPLPVASFPGGATNLNVATGQQIILDASDSKDPSGSALTYEWSIFSAPRGSKARIESPRNKITRFTPD